MAILAGSCSRSRWPVGARSRAEKGRPNFGPPYRFWSALFSGRGSRPRPGTTGPCELRDLRDDSRGAVMLIGLFMALSLIGALWFVIGIGDAIVFRDRGQELADAAALSSATIHARGMNFIAAINIIMLCLASFYLLAAMVADFLILVLAPAVALTGVGALGPAEAIEAAGWDVMFFAWDYAEGIAPILEALGIGQAVVAMTAPWVGSATGMDVATKAYDENNQGFVAFALGPSNVPGFGLTGGFGKGGGSGTFKAPDATSVKSLVRGIDATLGLPVAFEKNQSLCVRSAGMVLEAFKRFAESIPVIGYVMKLKFVSGIIEGLIGAASNTLGLVHCNEALPPWGLYGPKKMADSNGHSAFQVYGIAMNGKLVDDSGRKVQMGEGPKLGMGGTTQTVSAGYQAQAEFFYDCEDKWLDSSCNGNFIGVAGFGIYKWEHAIYSMKWKARLRRYSSPLQTAFDNVIGRFVNALFGTNMQGFLKGLPGIKKVNGILDGWAKQLGKIDPALAGTLKGKTLGQGVYDAIQKTLFDVGKRESKGPIIRGITGADGVEQGTFH